MHFKDCSSAICTPPFKKHFKFIQEREDARKNILQAAGRKVRETAVTVYGNAVGSAGGKEIIADKTYRDHAGNRMADTRFKKCMETWYFSVRRLPAKHIVNDLSKLEFSRAELAYIDMEVGSKHTCIIWIGSRYA